jgi:hypothetical protein
MTSKNQVPDKTKSNSEPSILLFVSALSLGAFSAYFFSKAGQDKWQLFSHQWEQVRGELFQKGLIRNPQITLDGFRREYWSSLQNIYHNFKKSMQDNKLEQQLQKLSKLRRRKERAKKEKFKGV